MDTDRLWDLKVELAKSASALLDPIDYLILSQLKHSGGSSQVEIQATLQEHSISFTAANVSRRSTKLEAQGFVQRAAGHNARTKRVTLTKRGLGALQDYERRLRAALPSDALETDFLLPCPECRARLRIKKGAEQRVVTCPRCKQAFSFRLGGGKVEIELDPHGATRPHQSPYAVLGIAPGAARSEAAEARRALMKKFHPDNFSHLNNSDFVRLATRKAQAVNSAYDEIAGA